MTQPQVVSIPTPGADKAPLSKAQREFNRLTQTIGEREAELRELRTVADSLRQRILTEYEPLVRSYNQLRANLVRLLDRAHGRSDMTRAETKKLADLILTLGYDLIENGGMDELKPIVDKYNKARFDAPVADADQPMLADVKAIIRSTYGIEFEEDADVSTPEKLMAYVEEQLNARRDAEQRQAEAQEDRKTQSAKQQRREAQKVAEQRSITKAVRTLYMDLVKAFHPDREPDEAEQIRKTEIMQRVTEAYQNSDLLALLRLQLDLNRIDQRHLERLADDQLRYYNKILKQQADELSHELVGLLNQLSTMLGRPVGHVGSASGLEAGFNGDVRQLKKRVKDLKKEVKELTDPATLKAWLKAYR